MRISVLGMGQMGRAFASRALERGHQVTVWNRTPGRAADLVATGAVEAVSAPVAVIDADVVLVVVADDAAVVEVCLGGSGVVTALGPRTVLANASTVAPETVLRLAAAGPEGRVLDTPVMGSPQAVAAGRGRFLIGAPPDAVTELAPLWHDLGSGYSHCGPVGSGATMKLISNFLLITGVAALAEGIAIARRNGMSDDLLRTVLAESPVLSPASRLRLENLLDRTHPGWFPPALARKDLRLAMGLAERTGVPASIGPAVEALLTKVNDASGQWADFSAVIEAFN